MSGGRREKEKGSGGGLRHGGDRGKVSPAFLKAERKKKAVGGWREEIVRRGRGSRAFQVLVEGEVPRVPAELRTVPKELASCSSQLASGHAMTATSAKEKSGRPEPDLRWRCGSARQTRISLKSASLGRKKSGNCG